MPGPRLCGGASSGASYAADRFSVLQERHLTGRDVVHSANQCDLPVVEILREVRASLVDLLHRLEDVLLGDLRDADVVFRIAAARSLDGRMYLRQKAGQVAQLRVVERGLDGAAARVPE